jgi:probable HAF family extracellular repeat protein
MSRSSIATSLSLLLILGSALANAQSTSSCTTTIITVNATGQVTPLGINASGTVTGIFSDTGFASHGFKWANGTGQLFDFPGASQTTLGAINNLGTAVGTLINSDGSSLGFTLDANGQTAQFAVPGFFSTSALGINNRGDIVGVADGVGFEKTGSTFKLIQFPGSVSTIPTSINDAGVIVGTYFDGDTTHSFVSANGKFVNFDVPGADSTDARGINDRGEIVGEFRQTAEGQGQGFTFINGNVTTFQFPGATFTEFSAVNAQGDRVGDTITSDVNLSGPAFLLTCR